MAKRAAVKAKRAPRRDLIEVLTRQFMPTNRIQRGQSFRVWINGVEATSVRAVDSEWEPMSMSYTKITDPIGSGVKYARRVVIEFAAPRLRQIRKPITAARRSEK